MPDKILVAFDGSDPSRKALDLAIEIAAKFHSVLLIVGVVRLPEPAISVEIDAMLERGQEHFAVEFSEVSHRCASAGVRFVSRVAVGHPAEQIIREAEETHSDLIVMGRRGTTLVTSWLLGSVSRRVLAYAHCPVIVVK
jgi:nucleotide-binding universal stress UspA family protein